MMRRLLSALPAFALALSGCGSQSGTPLELEGEVDATNAPLDQNVVLERAAIIRDAALAAGVTNPVLIAGVAAHESGGLHFCHGEGLTSCPGPASPDCGGGPILAGYWDGPCADEEGGLGFFQFDAGNYDQTLSSFGSDILTIAGNTRAGVDFIVYKVRGSKHTPDFGPFESPDTAGLENALAWLNGISVGDATYETYLTVLAANYNGCSQGCTLSNCNCDHEERRQSYHEGIKSMLALGDDFWKQGPGPVAEDPPPDPAPDPAPTTETTLWSAEWQGQEKYYWCGPASTRIALTARMGIGTAPSQSELADFLGADIDGTDHIGLVRDALNYYLGTSWFETKDMYDPPTQDQRDLLKKDIVFNVSKGYPLVANVVSGWRPPGYPSGTIYHYVSIIGYADDGESVLIADPAAEGSGGSGWSNVERFYWVSVWDLGTWIGGKGYTA